jgi:CO/xanthine dehydrogenase Mo-binding subunit
MQLRQAAAAARQALLAEAAKKLGTDNLTVADGVIMAGGRKKVSYAELIGDKNFSIKLDPKQPVKEKSPKDYKIVGKSTPRVDIPDKVTGRFTYMQDFRVPGMLHGRVVRPPAIGAKIEKVDESAVKKIPGVARVVREGDFLGVVATSEWDAIRGAEALKGHLVEIGNTARPGEALGARARHQDGEGRHDQQRGERGGSLDQGRSEAP